MPGGDKSSCILKACNKSLCILKQTKRHSNVWSYRWPSKHKNTIFTLHTSFEKAIFGFFVFFSEKMGNRVCVCVKGGGGWFLVRAGI